eukprot:scaffold14553_cov120-Isochrysis_galbana.AAC.10
METLVTTARPGAVQHAARRGLRALRGPRSRRYLRIYGGATGKGGGSGRDAEARVETGPQHQRHPGAKGFFLWGWRFGRLEFSPRAPHLYAVPRWCTRLGFPRVQRADLAQRAEGAGDGDGRLLSFSAKSEARRRHLFGKSRLRGMVLVRKTLRARGGPQWRPDSSFWSWRRWTWPRRNAKNVSALIAQRTLQCRCDFRPERPPASPT